MLVLRGSAFNYMVPGYVQAIPFILHPPLALGAGQFNVGGYTPGRFYPFPYFFAKNGIQL